MPILDGKDADGRERVAHVRLAHGVVGDVRDDETALEIEQMILVVGRKTDGVDDVTSGRVQDEALASRVCDLCG